MAGLAKGHDFHRFKRLDLPRVRKVIGILKGLQPKTLLDLGCGKGVFLWPLMETFPNLYVDAIDNNAHHVIVFNNAVIPKHPRAIAYHEKIGQGPSYRHKYDVVTLLEVLEHVEDPERVLKVAIQNAKPWLIITVPSKPDDNPEHINFFTSSLLERMLYKAGARKVSVDGIRNHIVILATV